MGLRFRRERFRDWKFWYSRARKLVTSTRIRRDRKARITL